MTTLPPAADAETGTPRAAIGWMLLSCVAFAAMWGMIRWVSETGVHAFLAVFYRNLVGALALSGLFLSGGLALLKTARFGLHARRATSGLIATFATFYAIANAPMTTVMAINYSVPLFATIAAILFLHERIRLRRIAALVIGFAGVLVVLRPGAVEPSWGIFAAVLSAVTTAFSILAMKELTRTEDPRAVTLFSFLLMLGPSLLIALPYWVWPTLPQLAMLVSIGLLASIGQTSLVRAFAAADASAVLPFDFVRMILIVLIAVLGFGEHLDGLAIVGGVVILASTVYLAHRETVVARSVKPTAVPRDE